MSGNMTKQMVLVAQGALRTNQDVEKVALFDSDGTSRSVPKMAAAQADTTAADLAALKVDFNALLAKLRTAGIIAP